MILLNLYDWMSKKYTDSFWKQFNEHEKENRSGYQGLVFLDEEFVYSECKKEVIWNVNHEKEITHKTAIITETEVQVIYPPFGKGSFYRLNGSRLFRFKSKKRRKCKIT